MPKPRLDAPRIVPRIGQCVAAGVPQACRSLWTWTEERQTGALADALHK